MEDDLCSDVSSNHRVGQNTAELFGDVEGINNGHLEWERGERGLECVGKGRREEIHVNIRGSC